MIDVQSGARAFDAALARANATVQREAPSDEWRIVDARCRCGRFARVTAASFRQTTIGPYISAVHVVCAKHGETTAAPGWSVWP
jgi:hypothetical protein